MKHVLDPCAALMHRFPTGGLVNPESSSHRNAPTTWDCLCSTLCGRAGHSSDLLPRYGRQLGGQAVPHPMTVGASSWQNTGRTSLLLLPTGRGHSPRRDARAERPGEPRNPLHTVKQGGSGKPAARKRRQAQRETGNRERARGETLYKWRRRPSMSLRLCGFHFLVAAEAKAFPP